MKPVLKAAPSKAHGLNSETTSRHVTDGRGQGNRCRAVHAHLPAGPILVDHSKTDQSCEQTGEPPLPQRACSPYPQCKYLAIKSSSYTSRHFEKGVKSTVFISRLRPVSSPCREHQLVWRDGAGSEVGSVINSSSGYCYRQGLVYTQRI